MPKNSPKEFDREEQAIVSDQNEENRISKSQFFPPMKLKKTEYDYNIGDYTISKDDFSGEVNSGYSNFDIGIGSLGIAGLAAGTAFAIYNSSRLWPAKNLTPKINELDQRTKFDSTQTSELYSSSVEQDSPTDPDKLVTDPVKLVTDPVKINSVRFSDLDFESTDIVVIHDKIVRERLLSLGFGDIDKPLFDTSSKIVTDLKDLSKARQREIDNGIIFSNSTVKKGTEELATRIDIELEPKVNSLKQSLALLDLEDLATDEATSYLLKKEAGNIKMAILSYFEGRSIIARVLIGDDSYLSFPYIPVVVMDGKVVTLAEELQSNIKQILSPNNLHENPSYSDLSIVSLNSPRFQSLVAVLVGIVGTVALYQSGMFSGSTLDPLTQSYGGGYANSDVVGGMDTFNDVVGGMDTFNDVVSNKFCSNYDSFFAGFASDFYSQQFSPSPMYHSFSGLQAELNLSDENYSKLLSNSLTHFEFSMSELSPEAFEVLAKSQSLTHVKLENMELSPEAAEALAKSQFLTHIELKNMKLNPEAAEALATSQSLSNMKLENMKLSPEAAEAFAKQALPSLTHIELKNVYLSDRASQELGWRLKYVTHMTLTNMRIDSSGYLRLFIGHHLQSLTHVKIENMSSSYQMIHGLSRLRSLISITFTNFKFEGYLPLRSLSESQSLTDIWLEHTVISEEDKNLLSKITIHNL